MDYDHETGEGDYSDYYTPSALIPMPDVFSIPPRCPDDVTEALRASFSCMWADPSAAANHLRSSLERLLDHLGVKRRSKATSGKVESLSLHARILLFEKTQPAIGRSLMALKWAGNSGSHGRSVSIDDLLDGYEILEHALQEIVEERSKRVAALAKKLSKKHAPKQR